MEITLSEEELRTIQESITYSMQRIRDAQDTPPAVRQENLAKLNLVAEKLKLQR